MGNGACSMSRSVGAWKLSYGHMVPAAEFALRHASYPEAA